MASSAGAATTGGLPDAAEERALQHEGFALVAGVDEAGRGAWAGPLVAGAVLVPDLRGAVPELLERVRDSKLLLPSVRADLYEELVDSGWPIGAGIVGSEEIDRLGLTRANELAMMRAVDGLAVRPDHLIIDAFRLPTCALPQRAIVRGDLRCCSVAAASIIAKVVRDRRLVELDSLYPEYGLARHKGYGVPEHRAVLARLGPSPIHRYSYAPIAACLRSAPA